MKKKNLLLVERGMFSSPRKYNRQTTLQWARQNNFNRIGKIGKCIPTATGSSRNSKRDFYVQFGATLREACRTYLSAHLQCTGLS